MKISDVARIIGVSTRTIRHYHHVGVLPEPNRTSNGYRKYALEDVALLAKIRKLISLGLTLEEVSDALNDQTGTELGQILVELDLHLAQQQAALQDLRERIKAHLAEPEPHLAATSTKSAMSFITAAEQAGAAGDLFALDRQLLSLVPEELLSQWFEATTIDLNDQATAALIAETYQLFEWLRDADPSDADVVTCADKVLELFPPHQVAELTKTTPSVAGATIMAALDAELSPAQMAVIHRVLQHFS